MIEILKKIFVFLDAVFKDDELDKLMKDAKGSKEWFLKIASYGIAQLFTWLTKKAVGSNES